MSNVRATKYKISALEDIKMQAMISKVKATKNSGCKKMCTIFAHLRPNCGGSLTAGVAALVTTFKDWLEHPWQRETFMVELKKRGKRSCIV